MKNVIVVGGGAAGWMTALFIKQKVPNTDVTVIASEEIGILGAGEGTVPLFSIFLQELNIDPFNVIEHCSGTIKVGIKFCNWLGTGDWFYHPFSATSPNENFSNDLRYDEALMIDEMLGLPTEFFSYDMGDLLGSQNKVTAHKSKRTPHAYHFDAVKLANFLKQIAIQRGIKYFDDFIIEFERDASGFMTKLIGKNNTYDSDFVFDCTGFRKLIIGGLYNGDWIDVSKRLPVNKAIPFFLPPNKELESVTTATAMDYGWVWQIPLQHRSGCGYVFNSNFCDEQKAIDEINRKYGEVETPKTFNFNSGYFRNPLIKNCLAIGLAGGFLEPLEATSIWTTMLTLKQLMHEVDSIFYKDDRCLQATRNINDRITKIYECNIDFIQLHYLSKRNDTEFWRYMNNDAPVSERLNSFIETLKQRPLTPEEVIDTYYNDYSWLRFAKQLNIIDKEHMQKRLRRIVNEGNYLRERKRLINILKYELVEYPKQNIFIDGILKHKNVYK